MMSVIEDRKEGFLLSVLVAPVPRSAIVFGKSSGRHDSGYGSGLDISHLAPLTGVHIGLAALPLIILTVFLVAFALTALGFAIAWPMDSTFCFPCVLSTCS